MTQDVPTIQELLDAWRDAIHAAELADRLAEVGAAAAERAEKDAVAAGELADMAETAASSAEAAAAKARAEAERLRAAAESARERGTQDRAMSAAARTLQENARDRYHEVEGVARAPGALSHRFSCLAWPLGTSTLAMRADASDSVSNSHA